jgi:ferric-dicitrate binding protein FerR (iron transport regulator)
MSWNTGQLTYDGQKLGIVFQDLRKMYGIEIIADDSSIMELPIATTFNHEQHETIIRIICTTFNLTYRQDGNIYHIGKK